MLKSDARNGKNRQRSSWCTAVTSAYCIKSRGMVSTFIFCVLFYTFTRHYSHLWAPAPWQHYLRKNFVQFFNANTFYALPSSLAILCRRIGIVEARLIKFYLGLESILESLVVVLRRRIPRYILKIHSSNRGTFVKGHCLIFKHQYHNPNKIEALEHLLQSESQISFTFTKYPQPHNS